MEETEAKSGEEVGSVSAKTMPVLSTTSVAVPHWAKPPGARTKPITQVIDFVGSHQLRNTYYSHNVFCLQIHSLLIANCFQDRAGRGGGGGVVQEGVYFSAIDPAANRGMNSVTPGNEIL